MGALDALKEIASANLFKRDKTGKWETGVFVGRPFYFDYQSARVLVADKHKHEAGGIPQGCFLLAYYENEPANEKTVEAVLLRVLGPTSLPTDSEIVGSMIQYYKEGLPTGDRPESSLDAFTKYDFSFSGLNCSVLGSFYRDAEKRIRFGADLENFYSAHNYSVVKPNAEVLARIVNHREDGIAGGERDRRIGLVRYSSSRRFQSLQATDVPVYVRAEDFAGKRTALFGMTRTGKSNTVKKNIQACVEMSEKAPGILANSSSEPAEQILKPFTDAGHPKYPIGQIIFDINGEYANANLQDAGTAIFELYKKLCARYSTVRKEGFLELKVNFYKELETGFELIRSHPQVAEMDAQYIRSFLASELATAADEEDKSAQVRNERRRAVYFCMLHSAGFSAPKDFRVRFEANAEIREMLEGFGVKGDPSKGVTLEQATVWWEKLWENYETDPTGCFADYQKKKQGRQWADEDLKALLVMLTRKRKPGGAADCSGFRVLRPLRDQHTETIQTAFELDILQRLRRGEIVIVDLSLGSPAIQELFTARVCRKIFEDAMARFTQAKANNFVQFYFEEAHNLFPKREERDLTNIYNRLAKEGAKLNLGIVYATQEVSSISANILKNTQNWFIAHLNNEDEIRELKKYYDFGDFAQGLIKFSQETDRGFVRMKSYSSPFVIPVQVDRFPPPKAK